jgi:hypothetical protein
LGRYEACQGQINPGAEGTHPQSFSQISNRFETKSGASIFAVGAFHPDNDRRLVSLRLVKFKVISVTYDANITTRVNGEYLWGRHFVFHYGKRLLRFPLLFYS